MTTTQRANAKTPAATGRALGQASSSCSTLNTTENDMTKTIRVPARINHDLQPRRAGDADGGWGLFEVATMAEAHAFARRNPDSQMPCWRRAECWGGTELGCGR